MPSPLALLLALATTAVAPAAPAATTEIVAPAQAAAPALSACTPEAIAAAEHPRLREGRCRRELREAVAPAVASAAPQACEPLQGPDGEVRCIPVRGGVRTAPPSSESGAAGRTGAARQRLRERAND